MKAATPLAILALALAAPDLPDQPASPARPLDPRPVANIYPAWSPAGDRIAFQSNRTGDYEIFVMRTDGSGLTRLTENDGRDVHPSWSPDGRRLVFASVRNASNTSAGRLHLYTMDADGSHPARLTGDPGEDAMPEWSPDGHRIAFLSDRTGKPEAYVIGADGSGLVGVTGGIPRRHTEVGNPHWHPDGSRLIFDADYGGTYDFYIIGLDGTGLRQVTHSPPASGEIFFPAYSRTGRLAFGRLVEREWKLFVAAADSATPVGISSPVAGHDFWPSWSPDGQRLVFASNRGGGYDIYLCNADGTGLVQLTHGAR